jgi:hypothetical protein
MTEQYLIPDDADDTEGHARARDDDSDDTEGHARARDDEDDGDDVEGHKV